MQPFWSFLRRMTRDAILAGAEDAIRYLEQNQPTDKQANLAEQLNQRLLRLGQEKLPTPPVPHHPKPSGNGQPQSPTPEPQNPQGEKRPTEKSPTGEPQADPPPRKRGPGRPPKEENRHADRA